MKTILLLACCLFVSITLFSQDNQIIDYTKTTKKVTLEKTPEFLEHPILEISKNKKVEVLEYLENEYWKVKYKNHIGYILGSTFLGTSLKVTSKMDEAVKVFKKKVSNDSIKKMEEFKKECIAMKEERLSRLLSEYTEEEVRKIESQEIWIGMNTNAAKEMFGYTSNINRSTGSWGVNEQWVYRKKGMYLYFQNGKLTSWQD